MKKQRLDAVQSLPNAYDHDFLEEYGDLFEGSYVRTDFATFELPEDDQPRGLKTSSRRWTRPASRRARTRSPAG